MSDTRLPVPIFFLPFFGMLAAIVPFAIDAYIPAIPNMALVFHVGVAQMNQTISAFLLGYALGQFFGGPISDQLGRKTIGYTGFAILLISTFAILFVQDFSHLKIVRFIQAIGGGFTSVICMASIRDAYTAESAGRKYAVVTMIMLFMPMLAPVIGSLLLGFGWQSIFIALFIFILAAAVTYYFGIPETRIIEHKSVDLKKIFRQFREVIVCKSDEGGWVIFYLFSIGFSAAVMLIFVTNSSFIYMEYFGVSPQAFPLYFGANVIVMMACVRYSMVRMKIVHPHKLFTDGNRIQFAFSAALILYVIFSDPSLFPILFLMVGVVGSMGLVNPNAAAVYISHYDKLSGSATSLNSTFILLMGGLMGGLVSVCIGSSLLPVAIGMFACSLVSNIIGASIPKPQGQFHKK
jgi:DHA1 family bicyclomycin/chloramphenicol resistance-like MFS transporter